MNHSFNARQNLDFARVQRQFANRRQNRSVLALNFLQLKIFRAKNPLDFVLFVRANVFFEYNDHFDSFFLIIQNLIFTRNLKNLANP